MSILGIVVLAAHVAIPFGVLGLVLAIVALSSSRGRALAAIVLSVAGIVLPPLTNLAVFGRLLPIGF